MAETNEYSVDPATGFLEKNEKNSFSPMEKTKFLKDFKRTGNQTKCAHDLGYSFRVIEEHLRKDLAFKRAFEEVLLEMRHEIEGELYSKALNGKTKEAHLWLQAHFPEIYKPSAVRPAKKEASNPVVDALYEKLS